MSDLMLPGSPEWCRRVSPSKAAAILGISPWDSPRSMWHKMRGDVAWDDETEAMERGNLLESGVLGWWRKHHDHTDWREQVSLQLDDWAVATPDAMCWVPAADQTDYDLCNSAHPDSPVGRALKMEPVVVEAKTSSDDEAWGDPGTDEVPAYYLVQAFLTAHIANLHGIPVRRIHMPVLGPRLRFANYVIEYDAAVGARLLERMKAWHDSLGLEVPPPLDDTVATYEAVRKVHPEIEQGVEVDLDEDLAVDLVLAKQQVDAGEAAARLARARAIEAMGRAQYAVCNGVRIARRQPRGEHASFVLVATSTDFTSTKELVS